MNAVTAIRAAATKQPEPTIQTPCLNDELPADDSPANQLPARGA